MNQFFEQLSDHYFDYRYKIETCEVLDLDQLNTQSDNILNARRYEATSYWLLKKIFHKILSFDHINIHSTHFYDLGCGKARVLCYAAMRGFRNIYGIDFAKNLIETSNYNIQSFTENAEKKLSLNHEFEIETQAQDFLKVNYSNQPSVYFLFNPCDGIILKKLLEKIDQDNELDKTIVYVNPLRAHLMYLNEYRLLYSFKHKNHNRNFDIFYKV